MAVEGAWCDRLSLVRFTGLSLDHDEVPDAATICRFRQSLVERNILKRLLDKFNHQLGRRGLLVREGAIVDASVVSSARRPRKVLDVLPEDREEDFGDAPEVTVRYADDADAAWPRKGNRAYDGYKIHAATDSRDAFVFGGHAREMLRRATPGATVLSVALACGFASQSFFGRLYRERFGEKPSETAAKS